MKTKKDYIIPEISILGILPTSMLCGSGVVAGGTSPLDDGVDETSALSNNYRNDWDNIWSEMQ